MDIARNKGIQVEGRYLTVDVYPKKHYKIGEIFNVTNGGITTQYLVNIWCPGHNITKRRDSIKVRAFNNI